MSPLLLCPAPQKQSVTSLTMSICRVDSGVRRLSTACHLPVDLLYERRQSLVWVACCSMVSCAVVKDLLSRGL